MFLFKKRKKKVSPEISEAIQAELSGYMTREELQEAIDRIKSDERKRVIWNGLSKRKKIALLRSVKKSGKR